ncbi:uncharacterized protein LOC116211619 isoform X2 [Punica granatum]|uniref:Uncharacterized protein LOC116211619 isoform X2 n=1 Tax=Punica granatum TaxID=22663 RepID=A0A6P8E341_PUNGR|nr:uncharacterized protein LOC116211619 isoform X2 [Punica granatum]
MAMSFRNTKHGFLFRLKALLHFPRFNHVAAESRSRTPVITEMGSESPQRIGEVDVSKWKKFDSRRFGITRSMIPEYASTVLAILRHEGFDAYLVGGCVRDLLLKRTPKDFDVITTANLQKVKSQFRRAQIVGRRFPICLVWIKGSVVEVSSFKTAEEIAEEAKEIALPPNPSGSSEKDFIRWRDSMRRDFTVNSLFLDPFMHKIYDYSDGLRDLKSLTLRTLIPAQSSFTEDCARILRGLRIAARLGLKLSEDTKDAIRSLSSTIKCLPQDRIMMEINYMLSYGAAEPSLHLLWRFRLLEILLPLQAAYLDQLDGVSSYSSSMLMKLFSNMDKWVSCGEPSKSILWIGLLAFHQALVRRPQDAIVVQAFGSILHFGWKEGVEYARNKANHGVHFVPEILGSSSNYEVAKLADKVSNLAALVNKSVTTLSDSKSLTKSMSAYSLSSCSYLVFVPKKAVNDVQRIFEVLDSRNNEESSCRKSLSKTRSLLGKIILETMSGTDHVGVESIEVERREHGKVAVNKQSDGVALFDSTAAEEHSRPKKLHRDAVADLSMTLRVPTEQGLRKRTALELWGYHGIAEKSRASWRKKSVVLGKEAQKERTAKIQKSIFGNKGNGPVDRIEVVGKAKEPND